MSADYAKASRVRKDVIELVKPPSRQLLSESLKEIHYVDQNGVMVPYDDNLTPYMREPADLLKSRLYDGVIFMGVARSGKTASLINGWAVDTFARNPADMLIAQITETKAAEWSKKELQRALMASPEARAAMSPRASDNNVHLIKTKAGRFMAIGWPSKNTFASSTFQYCALTDYDRMPLDIGGEGSAWTLGSKRVQTAMSRGMCLAESSPGHLVSDPGYRVSSPHEAPPAPGIASLYNSGDRRLFYWQCPDADCREWFEADFHLLQYNKEEKDPSKASADVKLCCPHCGGLIEEGQLVDGVPYKQWANDRGKWVPEGCRLDRDGVMHGTPKKTRIASFWQKGPAAAFQSWNQLVYKYLDALKTFELTGDMTPLQATINVDQGYPFTPPRSSDRDIDALMSRAMDLGVRTIPAELDPRFLVATIDVQGGAKRHWVVQVHAFTAELGLVVVDRFKIEKSKREDPDKPGSFVRVHPGAYLEDWDLITEKVLGKVYPLDDGSGRVMSILRVGCDSNGEDGVTNNAYAYYRNLKRQGLHRRFCLIKGASSRAAPLIEKKYPDNTGRKDRKAKSVGDVPLYFINTDRMKDIVSASLNRDTPGPRYCYFPDWLGEDFFGELIAEERDASGHWDKVTARNEAFDLMSYAWAMVHQLKADKLHDWYNRLPLWAETLDKNSEVFTVSQGEEGEEITAPKPKRRRRTQTSY